MPTPLAKKTLAVSGLVVCFAAGNSFARLSHPSPGTNSPPSTPLNPTPSSSQKSPQTRTSPSEDELSEAAQFAAFPLGKQIELISRLSSRYPGYLPTQSSLLYLKIVRGLSADQTKALLEGLPESARKHGSITRALVEHLTELDCDKAIETAHQLKDKRMLGRMLGIVFNTLIKKDVQSALLKVSELPRNEWSSALSGGSPLIGTGIRGDYRALLESLQTNPKIREVFLAESGRCVGLLARLMSTDSSDPAEALREFSRASQKLIQSRSSDPDVFDKLLESLTSETYINLRSRFPESASNFIDQVPGSIHLPYQAIEASSRLKSRGVESALQYVEKLQSEEQIKAASGGFWKALAESDPAAASTWIGQLPEGPVKEGVLLGVAAYAVGPLNLYDWEGRLRALIAAAQTLPAEQHLAYYRTIALPIGPSDRWPTFVDQGHVQEFIDAVPLPFEKKQALIRALAPLK
jgi:hypothetical protein